MDVTHLIAILLTSLCWCLLLETVETISLGQWTYRDKDGHLVEVIDTHVVNHRKRQELERNKRCRCYCRRKWEDNFVCCECSDTTCFPWASVVTLENGHTSKIGQLSRGDRVLTADLSGNVYPTTVVGYLDYRSDVISLYHVIHTTSGDTVSLSGSHVIYVSSTNDSHDALPRYAKEVRPGDFLLIKEYQYARLTKVDRITEEGMIGAFVPLTETGTLLVNNVLTSCYASFPHHMAHIAMAPLRWFPALTWFTPEGGAHPYVRALKAIGRVVLPSAYLFADNHINHSEANVVPGRTVGPDAVLKHSDL